MSDTNAQSDLQSAYAPFDLPTGVRLAAERGPSGYDTRLVARELRGSRYRDIAAWPLRFKGLKPGHGALMLDDLVIEPGCRFLDLCSGPIAFFAGFAVQNGAEEAVAIDIDPAFARVDTFEQQPAWFRRVEFRCSDLLGDSIGGKKFDAAAFHPPMLPLSPNQEWDRHSSYDFSGPDGRDVLDRGIIQLAEAIRPGGHVVIGQFEFLGVDEQFGLAPSTFDRLRAVGFAPLSAKLVEVPVTPIIDASVPHIMDTYPRYNFVLRAGQLFHRFAVICARRES